MGDKSRTGIHEHADEDRYDGEGQHIDTQYVVLHHQGYQDGEDGDERIEHHQTAWFLEVVFPEEGYIQGEENHDDAHEKGLSCDG